MKIGCICPTYDRVSHAPILLEEAIESFLRQDYEHKVLLIINDCKNQIITCDIYQVEILNLNRRSSSLGEKYNTAINLLSDCDAFAPWEDDDISLPWRLSHSVEMLKNHNVNYYNPKQYWFYNGQYNYHHSIGVSHNCSMFTRQGFVDAGGYPFISGAQDMVFDRKLIENTSSFIGDTLPPEKWFYINRWNTNSYHLSGNSNHNKYYSDIGKSNKKLGVYSLKPKWINNYVEIIEKTAT